MRAASFRLDAPAGQAVTEGGAQARPAARDAPARADSRSLAQAKRLSGMFGFDAEAPPPKAATPRGGEQLDSGDASDDATLALRLLNAVDGVADDAAAVAALRAKSDRRGGCADADFALALLHATGVAGIAPRDDALAAALLRRAALAGHGGAQLRYAARLGAEGDAAQRARFLRRAAEQPEATRVRAAAALALGGAYSAGAGVDADVSKAALWLHRAAADAAATGAAADAAAAAAALDALLVCANAACPHADSAAAKQQLRACDSCTRTLVCCAACGDAHWADAHAGEEPLYDADDAEDEPELRTAEDADRRTRQRLS